jgi:hypothetical protein
MLPRMTVTQISSSERTNRAQERQYQLDLRDGEATGRGE